MMSTSRRIVAAATALAAIAAGSACSTPEDHSPPATSTTASETVAAHNADDIMFAQMMIPHHQQAVELSALAPARTTNRELLTLASNISAQQQPEINAMKALLLQWDVDPNAMPDHGGHGGHGGAMQGMIDDATMAKLESLEGPAFDTLWLQAMISHHQGAVEMAKAEIANGRSADMTAMAKSMVTAQEAEINQMKQMLGG
ncbi:DUF305 domain-containing protein [Mycobacterium sp. CVI_P3]|uniref:DUF305 domain-containing protein n=1 Tax=Mycobacterium pinniadriaticum TaxID=2994102 RepID=A0ABT3SHJ7_9MYCO|nr:DUF305 domain-containing protein [Mycobacterium pinniadriaticum]MCX2931842.1 DUF305 domain-containing protein [Mycobacterium pinniadriaticum]MCX2938347.1 DUF305 domain-containing protein [Mycobacterium pinniadriaticum]